MSSSPPLPNARDIAAALDWWREAGVDCGYGEEPTEWLADTVRIAAVAPPEASPPAAPVERPPLAPATPDLPPIGGDQAAWPTELEAFQSWFATSSDLDSGGAFPALAPRGAAGAAVMVLVEEPEEADTATLLSGPQGQLLDSFLAAAGIAPGQVYRASVLRRHTPLADWAELGSRGIGDLLAHHIGLAAPERIISFGRNILPLLGNGTAQEAASLRQFNHQGRTFPLLGTGPLAGLLRSPAQRQRLWLQWLDWTDG